MKAIAGLSDVSEEDVKLLAKLCLNSLYGKQVTKMKIKKTSEYKLKFCNEKDIELLKMWIMLIGTEAEDWCRRWMIETFTPYGEKLFESVKKDIKLRYEVEFSLSEDSEVKNVIH